LVLARNKEAVCLYQNLDIGKEETIDLMVEGAEGKRALDVASLRANGLRDVTRVHEHGVDDERDHVPRR
jgi:hypothetical protein